MVTGDDMSETNDLATRLAIWRAMEPKAKEFAKEHRRFLKDNRPDVYQQFKKDGDLFSYLSSVGNSAQEMYEHLLAKSNNRPEIQNLPFHQRVTASQNNRQSAEELVRDDIIFQPRADSEMDESEIKPIRDWDEDVLDAALKNWPAPKAKPSRPTLASVKSRPLSNDEVLSKPLRDWAGEEEDAALEDWPKGPKA